MIYRLSIGILALLIICLGSPLHAEEIVDYSSQYGEDLELAPFEVKQGFRAEMNKSWRSADFEEKNKWINSWKKKQVEQKEEIEYVTTYQAQQEQETEDQRKQRQEKLQKIREARQRKKEQRALEIQRKQEAEARRKERIQQKREQQKLRLQRLRELQQRRRN